MAPGVDEDVDESRQTLVRHFQFSEEEHAFDKEEQVEVLSEETRPFSWKKLWLFTGPGVLMSIGYLDPGNLESDLQSGAIAGYSLLWLLMWATMMGLIIQLLSARLGVTTGYDLAEICREVYPFWTRIILWLMAEVAIIGADIQEVIGSAIALRILSFGYIPLWGGVLITGMDGFVFLFLENFGIRKLEVLFEVLILVMAVSFACMFAQAQPSMRDLLAGLIIPRVSSSTVSQAVGVVGALIMPHNIFLHSALVQSRTINISSIAHVKEALRYYTIESACALLISFIINLFVIAVFSEAFYGTDIAESIGLANAGEYLQAHFGNRYFPILYIWAIGLLAAGQSSTMTGTYAGQFVMSGFLDLRVKRWIRAVMTRAVAILPTVIIALIFDGSNERLDTLNEWLNVLQSIQLPFAVIPLLCVVSSKQIMGFFRVGPIMMVLSWIIALLVVVINGYLLVEFCSTFVTPTVSLISLLGIAAALYIIFIIYLVIHGWCCDHDL
ncbi:hypothetical protein KP509_39G032100 [Ceratopteris richardii]|uniref:Uncharacterized protein n=1 Tax=Ceratopteris richardii TaxID=49495 RepID=A0A8T2PZP5_CERRI|nr:hypothetical protein KP509_39G032100 [Ceratopteris richardii]